MRRGRAGPSAATLVRRDLASLLLSCRLVAACGAGDWTARDAETTAPKASSTPPDLTVARALDLRQK